MVVIKKQLLYNSTIMTSVEPISTPSGVTQFEHGPLTIAYSGIDFGNVDVRPRFGDPESAIVNQARLLRGFRASRFVLQEVRLRPQFEDLSGTPDEELSDRYQTDGLIIDRPGIALGLNPADCNSMTIFDRNGGVAGLIHAGRQGVDGDIHLASLAHLVDKHSIAREDIGIHFGPSIREESYYYPTEGFSAEQLADPKWKTFIDKRAGSYHIDLLGRIVKDVVEAGIEPDQIEIVPVDTGADSRYFSHTRSKRTGEPHGRNGHVVMINSK